jgi:hypothetical protein
MKLSLLHISEALRDFTVAPNRRDLDPGLSWIAKNKPDTYDAHTIAKGMNSEALASLDAFLTGKIDPSRPLHTVIITAPSSALAAGFGGGMYGPFSSGYAVILSAPNQMLEQNGRINVSAVLIADIWKSYLSKFQAQYPNIKFLTNETISSL